MRNSLFYFFIPCLFSFLGCHDHGQTLRISGDIEEPKNELVTTLTKLVNEEEHQHLTLEIMSNNIAHIDSLISGQCDLMIVDNNLAYHDDVSVLIPLYPQILHILHKKNFQPTSLLELLKNKKIYAGESGAGSRKLLDDLLYDFQIRKENVELLNVIDLFKADVIMLFTDLISLEELVDLHDYQFYSLDQADQLGSGTTAEAISLRHPQFQPYILPSYIYGEKTKEAILTILNEAILVCRKDADPDDVYELAKLIHNNKQVLYKISPLLHHVFNEDYDIQNLVFPLHEGARQFIERDKPGFIEKNTGLIGILITLLIAAMSGLYTFLNYRAIKKKNIIDQYYAQLISIRQKINQLETEDEVEQEFAFIRSMQDETIDLVIEEKLSANESYLVFMRLVKIINEELSQRLKSVVENPQIIK